MRPPSIQRTLLTTLSLIFVLMVIGSSTIIIRTMHDRISQDYDAQLIADANLVWHLVREELSEGDSSFKDVNTDFGAPSLSDDHRAILSEYSKWRAFRVWKNDHIVKSSHFPLSSDIPAQPLGFHDYTFGKAKWRVYTLTIPKETVTVEAWEDLTNRKVLLNRILISTSEPLLLVLPTLIFLLYISVRHGLSSIEKMSKILKSRQSSDLSQLEILPLSIELAPLQSAINALLVKVRNAMTRERELVDNAAHELKTPLAAIRLQSQLILDAPTPEAQKDMAKELISSVDRTTKLFEQLILLSRIHHADISQATFAASSFLREVISDYALIAHSKGIEITLEDDGHIFLTSNPKLLTIMLGAFLDNAIKYSPANDVISLVLKEREIVLTDHGPGIPDEDRNRVYDRFYRGKNTHLNPSFGSGLGLSIARQIAEILSLTIKLEERRDGTHGLVVRILFS